MELMGAVRASLDKREHRKTSFIGFDVLGGDNWRSAAVDSMHTSSIMKERRRASQGIDVGK